MMMKFCITLLAVGGQSIRIKWSGKSEIAENHLPIIRGQIALHNLFLVPKAEDKQNSVETETSPETSLHFSVYAIMYSHYPF